MNRMTRRVRPSVRPAVRPSDNLIKIEISWCNLVCFFLDTQGRMVTDGQNRFITTSTKRHSNEKVL